MLWKECELRALPLEINESHAKPKPFRVFCLTFVLPRDVATHQTFPTSSACISRSILGLLMVYCIEEKRPSDRQTVHPGA